MKIKTWCRLGVCISGHEQNETITEYIDVSDLGCTEDQWRLMGDDDKENYIEKWWFDNYIVIGHIVANMETTND
jgi:hypothetical protein